jgi:hypothetical protein
MERETGEVGHLGLFPGWLKIAKAHPGERDSTESLQPLSLGGEHLRRVPRLADVRVHVDVFVLLRRLGIAGSKYVTQLTDYRPILYASEALERSGISRML